MDELIEEVRDLVTFEYQRAAAKFGNVNHSDHESYSILLEEKEEADTEHEGVGLAMQYLWDLIKQNGTDEQKLKICSTLETRAVLAASEFIQVAAMAAKAAATIRNREAGGDK